MRLRWDWCPTSDLGAIRVTPDRLGHPRLHDIASAANMALSCSQTPRNRIHLRTDVLGVVLQPDDG